MLPLAALFVFPPASPGLAAAPPRTFRRTIERVPGMDPVTASSAGAARVVGLVYECLLEYEYEARPYRLAPGLAALPDVSEDGLSYLFRLDPEARFAADPCFGTDKNGAPLSRPVTAFDAVYSFRRLADARLASPGYWTIQNRIRGVEAFRERTAAPGAPDAMDIPWDGVEALDAHTLRITLERPCPQFLWILAMAYASIVPHEAVAFYGSAFAEHPVGSGPYRLSRWRRNYVMEFERNQDWPRWNRAPGAPDDGPPFDRILFLVMDDASTQWLSFLAGELDFQGEIGRDNWDVVFDPSGGLSPGLEAAGIRLTSMETLEVAYIGLNMDDPVLGPNKPLRQALNLAVDATRWVEFYNRRVTMADGPIPLAVAGRADLPSPRDLPAEQRLGRARELLAEAGYPEGRDPATGRRLSLTLDLGRTTQDMRESTELLAAFFDRIGIELKAEYHNWPAFLRKLSRRESQMFRIGWVGDYPDAENFLQLFYGPSASPGPNRCNYANPEFDRLFEAAMVETDDAKRYALYAELDRIVREDCPWIFLHYPRNYSLYRSRVRNYRAHDFPYGMEKYLRDGSR
jgi:oligopeptide transport system substrate-binding protein